MTQVYYQCKDVSGDSFNVTTLCEAQAVKDAGGSYNVCYKENASKEVAYARKDSRRHGDMR